MQRLLKNQNKIFSYVNKNIKKHPYFCVIILHEYFRNIFPYDPIIKFKTNNPKKRIDLLQKRLINLFKSLESFGSYKINFKNFEKKTELKKKTGKVYGKFWGTFSRKENRLAKKFIQERFKNFKSFKKFFFKNKKIIDVGCGGGRYSNALKLLGAKSVIGVDYSDDGLKIAKKNYKHKNLFFLKQNFLNLKFKSRSFDIVFSNGVLHHTSNLEKGIEELHRICKKGGYIYLYLYGAGGLYWSARKKMNKLMKKIPQEMAWTKPCKE